MPVNGVFPGMGTVKFPSQEIFSKLDLMFCSRCNTIVILCIHFMPNHMAFVGKSSDSAKKTREGKKKYRKEFGLRNHINR